MAATLKVLEFKGNNNSPEILKDAISGFRFSSLLMFQYLEVVLHC